MPDQSTVEQQTRLWVENIVAGLNLCPFVKPVLLADSLRIAVTDACTIENQLECVASELILLQEKTEQQLATTLLVFQEGLKDFYAYLDFVDQANQLLDLQDLRGEIQIASFHPDYLFADEKAEALSHYTNRSPWPTLHFIREAQLSRVLANYPDPEKIPENNIKRLDDMGHDAVEAVFSSIKTITSQS